MRSDGWLIRSAIAGEATELSSAGRSWYSYGKLDPRLGFKTSEAARHMRSIGRQRISKTCNCSAQTLIIDRGVEVETCRDGSPPVALTWWLCRPRVKAPAIKAAHLCANNSDVYFARQFQELVCMIGVCRVAVCSVYKLEASEAYVRLFGRLNLRGRRAGRSGEGLHEWQIDLFVCQYILSGSYRMVYAYLYLQRLTASHETLQMMACENAKQLRSVYYDTEQCLSCVGEEATFWVSMVLLLLTFGRGSQP
jgi:hypothetical protein